MTDYERDYTSRLEKRLRCAIAECDMWRRKCLFTRFLLAVLVGAVLATAAAIT